MLGAPKKYFRSIPHNLAELRHHYFETNNEGSNNVGMARVKNMKKPSCRFENMLLFHFKLQLYTSLPLLIQFFLIE